MKQSTLRALYWLAIGLVLAIFAAAPAMAADSAGKMAHVRGEITAVSDSGFTLRTKDGKTRQVAIDDSTKFAGVVPSSLDEIEKGTFIGTANVEGDDGHRALEVVVFPDAMKGTGLGDYPWDLAPSKAQGSASADAQGGDASSMTNGTVTQESGAKTSDSFTMGGSTMTNGTVTESSDGDTMAVKVDYGDGSKRITIPKDVPVVALQKGSQSDIKTGAHVFLIGPAGSEPFAAKRVMVGIDGTVPPM